MLAPLCTSNGLRHPEGDAIDTSHSWLPHRLSQLYLGPQRSHPTQRGLPSCLCAQNQKGLALDGCLCPSEQTVRTAPLRNAKPSARASTSRSLHRDGTWEFKTQMNLEAEPPNFWEGKYESASRVGLPSTTRGSSTTNHFFQSAQLGWLVPGFAKVSAVIE